MDGTDNRPPPTVLVALTTRIRWASDTLSPVGPNIEIRTFSLEHANPDYKAAEYEEV